MNGARVRVEPITVKVKLLFDWLSHDALAFRRLWHTLGVSATHFNNSLKFL
jgi:hypothetical protein